jgi:hypothetical protein
MLLEVNKKNFEHNKKLLEDNKKPLAIKTFIS